MPADMMILGENVAYSTDCTVTGLNNNVLVCGCSGCGKTMSIVEPRLLEAFNSSLIVTLTKRRIVQKYRSLFERRGYIVEDLNFIDPTASDMSYDPLQYIASYADISFLAEAVVNANPKKGKSNADPYWDEAAISLLSAEIAYTLMTKGNATFVDVLKLHDNLNFSEGNGSISTSLDEKFEYIGQVDPSCFAFSCWKSFHQLPIKTAGCVYGTLNTTLDTIFNPELRKMIVKKRKVDFERLSSKKTVLFVSTSAVNPALHSFVNVFYAQAFKSLFEYAESLPSGKLPIPVHVICDDFATGGRILNFPEYISIFREKQVSVTLLVQSESQLAHMYGSEDATTVVNNCDSYLYMGGMDLKTGHSVSERMNICLEDVLEMPIGQIFVFRRGQKPIVTQRYNILENELYQTIMNQYHQNIASHNR